MRARTVSPNQQSLWRPEVQGRDDSVATTPGASLHSLGGLPSTESLATESWLSVPPSPLSAAARRGAMTSRLGEKWGWRNAHHGAGATTLARELGGADLGMTSVARLPTLVVCRASADGLMAAQQLAARELSGAPRWSCLGLVVVADDCRPMPSALMELAALITAGYPAHWPLPWMESWRTASIMTQPMVTQLRSRPAPKRPAHAAPRRIRRHPRRTHAATKEQP
jgi:hypothetical protein